ncbi:16S rRNA (guanine(966)-N(2))-methyltransferase RsmD [Litchfieldella xinjiangensis]|uniref:16S rRNA (guanine(966)-N(2))-methyltransferase RsmD n=1 Tax=Litchfieldella xinjiangensis TaxID=1166948 RepID=UPI0005BA3165|nr:16S rRNA (guanine(966)-N(2))-methyltransferase RsmD [Halomonas xinjiangensis]
MNRRSSSRPRRGNPKNVAPPAAGHKGSGKLRIIGGEYRRRLLPILDSPGLRPTPDRVRETLFNWLAQACPGASVLDLYAGTGALGLEALSRGARAACFVEKNPAVSRALKDNLNTLDARGEVVAADAAAFLEGPASPYDLVFLDPPFRQDLAAVSCHALENRGWLAAVAYIYVETEHELEPDVPASWERHREVRAGDSTGRLYRRTASPPSDGC